MGQIVGPDHRMGDSIPPNYCTALRANAKQMYIIYVFPLPSMDNELHNEYLY